VVRAPFAIAASIQRRRRLPFSVCHGPSAVARAKFLVCAACFLISACAASAPFRGDHYHPPHEHGEVNVPEPVALECTGAMEQGGAVICKSTPGAEVRLDGDTIGYADADGWITINISRQAPPRIRLEAHYNGVSTFVDLSIARR
jgi:hypothetical protein